MLSQGVDSVGTPGKEKSPEAFEWGCMGKQ